MAFSTARAIYMFTRAQQFVNYRSNKPENAFEPTCCKSFSFNDDKSVGTLLSAVSDFEFK